MKTKAAPTRPEPLSLDNLSSVTGGATCLYESKEYSPGAKITLQNGTVQTCQKDGTWT